MKIVTAAEMRNIDRVTTERFGVPSLTLMGNAGTAVAEHVLSHYPSAQRIVVLCGKGNNGGDGFVAARHLQQQRKTVEVILLADPADLRGDAAEMYRKLPVTAVVVRSGKDLKNAQLANADLYLDAILGAGFKPPVKGLYAEAIEILNHAQEPVVAIDIPSGADNLLTSGTTEVAGIGSPSESIESSLHLNVITARDIAALVAPRPAESNKGNYGHVLVVGGSRGKAGAAAMAGMSVLRAGAGLSTVATAKSVLPTVAGFHPEIMTEPLPETAAGSIALRAKTRVAELAKGKSVLAIGPGISRVPETSNLVRTLVGKNEIPIVLDADGLNAFEGKAKQLNGEGRTLVITPHPGEMARLAGCSVADVQKNRLRIARTFAREHGLIVVLKGHRTLVVQPHGEAWVNMTGNPGMSTGGTGDILTGMVAAMIAQNPNNPVLAVCAAVHLHGLSGDIMRESIGEHAMVATDLLRGLPEAFRRTQIASREKFMSWGA
jgi:ADP-dependent NAD(P)H-hydrate dehydratase / NAD(P)H-hydrate epimerase